VAGAGTSSASKHRTRETLAGACAAQRAAPTQAEAAHGAQAAALAFTLVERNGNVRAGAHTRTALFRMGSVT
jgi:hypothetical protein